MEQEKKNVAIVITVDSIKILREIEHFINDRAYIIFVKTVSHPRKLLVKEELQEEGEENEFSFTNK